MRAVYFGRLLLESPAILLGTLLEMFYFTCIDSTGIKPGFIHPIHGQGGGLGGGVCVYPSYHWVTSKVHPFNSYDNTGEVASPSQGSLV